VNPEDLLLHKATPSNRKGKMYTTPNFQAAFSDTELDTVTLFCRKRRPKLLPCGEKCDMILKYL